MKGQVGDQGFRSVSPFQQKLVLMEEKQGYFADIDQF